MNSFVCLATYQIIQTYTQAFMQRPPRPPARTAYFSQLSLSLIVVDTLRIAGGVWTSCELGRRAEWALTFDWHAINTRPYRGLDLYAGLEFSVFFQVKSQGVDLYADRLIREYIRYFLASWAYTFPKPVDWAQQLSSKLVNLRHSIPAKFARKPQCITEIDRWKATEFRQFLLYTGPVVLFDVLPCTVYNHFLLLSVAIILLLSPKFCGSYADYAHSLLCFFVEQANHIYGEDFIGSLYLSLKPKFKTLVWNQTLIRAAKNRF